MPQRSEPGALAEGVGVTFHPLLLDALLGMADAFDFIELPLDLYLDPARSTLLDPGGEMLREALALKPCVWRGTALSLGTAADGFAPATIRGIRRLLDRTGVGAYADVIGYRRAGGTEFGGPRALPWTPGAAALMAERHGRACEALGVPVLLEFSAALPGSGSGSLNAAGFLHAVAAQCGAELAVHAKGLPPEAASTLPGGRVAAVVVEDGADPQIMDAVGRLAGVRAAVVRRTRNLFPLDRLREELRRAAACLAAPRIAASGPVAPVAAAEPDLAREQALQAEAADTVAWRNWRDQVDETYKAMQIAVLMGQRAGQPAPGRTP